MTIIVATYIVAKKSAHRGPGGMQQFRQCPKPRPPQVAQLLAVGISDRFIETSQKFEPVGRDPGQHHSPILGLPGA